MKRRKSINSKAVTGIVILIILVVSFIGSYFVKDGFGDKLYNDAGLRDTSFGDNSTMYVSFIDVGQGNCTLVTCGDSAILVDSGEAGEAQNVINYIKNRNIDKLDCVVATHPHSDHIGGMAQILTEFEIKDVIMPEIPEDIVPTTKIYEKFLNAVAENAENVIAAESGMTYSYGEMKLEIFAPLKDYDNLNDMSVISRISYGETSVMFTGDATTAVEKDLLKKKIDYSADILNVGHHGSKTSSSEQWLKAVSPEYAVICCGKGNDYGHPHSVVTERLEKFGIAFYRTDIDGTVIFASDSRVFTKYD